MDDAIVFADAVKAIHFYTCLPLYAERYGIPREKFFYNPSAAPETVRFGGLALHERLGLDGLLADL